MKDQVSHIQPKVLFITYEYGEKVAGGIGRVINGVTNHIRNSSGGCGVLLLKWSYLKMHFSGDHFKLHGVASVKTEHSEKYTSLVINLIQKEGYRVVHILHSGKETASCIEAIKISLPEIKIVYSCHSIVKHELAIRNNKLEELKHEASILDNVHQIHLLNHSSKKYLIDAYPHLASHPSLNIIPNGVDEAEFRAKGLLSRWSFTRKLKIGSHEKVVLCMSRWSHGKGLEYLADAIGPALELNPDLKFIIAGRKASSWENGVGDYVSLIDQKLKKHSKNIIVFEWLDAKERNILMSLASIWVMPSQLEYFPYSLLEPMAAGLPIISSRIDCAEEMLADDITCLFYPTESPEILAKKIGFLSKDRPMRQLLSSNAKLLVRDKYSWDIIGKQYLEMYQSIVLHKEESLA